MMFTEASNPKKGQSKARLTTVFTGHHFWPHKQHSIRTVVASDCTYNINVEFTVTSLRCHSIRYYFTWYYCFPSSRSLHFITIQIDTSTGLIKYMKYYQLALFMTFEFMTLLILNLLILPISDFIFVVQCYYDDRGHNFSNTFLFDKFLSCSDASLNKSALNRI